jgi:hypothetical protein
MNEKRIITLMSMLKHKIYPRPFERLAVKGENLIGAEIGVREGCHAQSLLKHLDIHRLYLIDPYLPYCENGIDIDTRRFEVIARKRMKRFEEKVEFVKHYSYDCYGKIPDELDFVYIDGNHDYESVKRDIEDCFPKIRIGGILGGHDFYNGFARMHDGVVKAVTEFVVYHELGLQVEMPDWWIKK